MKGEWRQGGRGENKRWRYGVKEIFTCQRYDQGFGRKAGQGLPTPVRKTPSRALEPFKILLSFYSHTLILDN